MGYQYNGYAENIIRECDDWYAGKVTAFHKRTNINNATVVIKTLNFAKRLCGDDANLCEIVEINAGDSEDQFEGVKKILEANRFDTMYRKYLDKMAASGTVGAYVWLDNADLMSDGTVRNGNIRINYVNADGIVPITVINDEIIEVAFAGTNIVNGNEQHVLVVFTLNNGKYVADSYYFNEDGKEIIDLRASLQLAEVKPFAIMRVAEVNNLDDMEGYGYPKLYNSIPVLECLDLAYNILYGDLDKGEKLVFINELLACIKTDNQGNKYLSKKQQELFILLGEHLPDQDGIIKEYNPELRIDAITKIFETCLSLLSMSFGYGTKKYTFENGQIKSATEYIGEKQDAMQELNKQRAESTQYIKELCKAIIWFNNQFNGTAWDVNQEILIDFDDSYIEDRNAKLESMRADALSFPELTILTVWYIAEKYNLSEDEAKKIVLNGKPDDLGDGEDDE